MPHCFNSLLKHVKFPYFSINETGEAALSELWPLTFGVVCTDRKTEVTFALALLHGCWPLMIHTLIGRLACVGQTLHRTHLLTQTTLGRTLRHEHTNISTGNSIKTDSESIKTSHSNDKPKAYRTSPHGPVTHWGGGQRWRLQRTLEVGRPCLGHFDSGSVSLFSPLLHKTTRCL